MENRIINNLFEFWEFIGTNAGSLHKDKGYKYLKTKDLSWPNRIFEIDTEHINYKELYQKIEKKERPELIALAENESVEKQFLDNHFVLKSEVKGMILDLKEIHQPENNFTTIEKLDSENKAIEFAKIASGSFGYNIQSSTILQLVNKQPKIKLYICKHENSYAGCGILYLDKNGYSGLHMIGTLPAYRGFGLGKIMTNKLLFEAFNNLSKYAVLVASEGGEKIYSKIGFVTKGALKTYSIKANVLQSKT